MSRGRTRKDSGPPCFATHMLALAKPLSMSMGRGKHEEGRGSARLIADDCLKYLFVKSEKRVQEKEIHSLSLNYYMDRIGVDAPRSRGWVLLARRPTGVDM
jgi:hypothetical protein